MGSAIDPGRRLPIPNPANYWYLATGGQGVLPHVAIVDHNVLSKARPLQTPEPQRRVCTFDTQPSESQDVCLAGYLTFVHAPAYNSYIMTHIANCMRRKNEKLPDSVYLAEETSASSVSVSGERYRPLNSNIACQSPPTWMEGFHQHFFNRSLSRSPSAKPPTPCQRLLSPVNSQLESPIEERSPSPPSPMSRTPGDRSTEWPIAPKLSPSRSPSETPIGVSPSKSNDSISTTGRTDNLPTFIPRLYRARTAETLSRRRKKSVPELSRTMTTVQEHGSDSRKEEGIEFKCKGTDESQATIPGLPPLHKVNSEPHTTNHERSNSAPGGSWRPYGFNDSNNGSTSLSSTPPRAQPNSARKIDGWATEQKPLSPIFSPPPSSRPNLKLDTKSPSRFGEKPPEVPPKSPAAPGLQRKGSIGKLVSKYMKSSSSTPASAIPTPSVPTSSIPSATPVSAAPVSSITSPESKNSPSLSNSVTNSPQTHHRNASEISILDRGRPVRRPSKKRTAHSRDNSQTSNSNQDDLCDLPSGITPQEAETKVKESERVTLRKQAVGQAMQFEVLSSRDVATLSRELRAVDERCDYLRKTYKSLRGSRQVLHNRMVTYLKRSQTITFSRQNLLKQEEALVELDRSIDDWILKLERAENRRLRVRQKLLEHVAAAMALNTGVASLPSPSTETPPKTPVRVDSPMNQEEEVAEETEAAKVERGEIQSIQVYADPHVLSLFADIDRAIGEMSEMVY